MGFRILLSVALLCASVLLSNARPSHHRHLTELVQQPSVVLNYHKGPLLSGKGTLNVYLIWYGSFTPAQRAIVKDFLASFSSLDNKTPSVSSWWKRTAGYKDAAGKSVLESVKLGAESSDPYSLGKNLKKVDMENLVKKASNSKPFAGGSNVLYLLLTSDDVNVEGFCVQTCASHSAIKRGKKQAIPYAWVGNSATQCPGKCAWPFASAKNYFGPDTKPLIAPNGDVGIDGMIINIATIVAGTATNPFTNGYYQGDAKAPLEAATACTGIFGKGAYSGYPGDLMADKNTGVSFNAWGIGSRAFLLPALWDPSTSSCAYPSP